MAIRPFLAMTAAEMGGNSVFPRNTAWMACHFSPYGLGLCNLPSSLPPDSLLILNDRTPIRGHDCELIVRQLGECVGELRCFGVLLDFQRPGDEEAAALANVLTEALPCPVGVSQFYAEGLDCPVFLPPVPPSEPLVRYLEPWQGREVWLELALDGEEILLTEQGARVTSLPYFDPITDGFYEKELHCHYQIRLEDEGTRFTLWRTQENLEGLIAEAEALGISTMVGLYQELHQLPLRSS